MHKTSRSGAALFLPDNITTKPRHRRPSHSPEKSPHRAPLIFTGSQKVQFLALSLNEFQLWATVVLKRGEISAPFLPCCIECRAVPYERLFSLVFWEKNGWWGRSLLSGSINANRKSITRFPMSLRWSSYVAPKQKRKNGRFRVKWHFA